MSSGTGTDLGMGGDPTGASCRTIPSPQVRTASISHRGPWRGTVGEETHPRLIASAGLSFRIVLEVEVHQPRANEGKQKREPQRNPAARASFSNVLVQYFNSTGTSTVQYLYSTVLAQYQ